MNMRSEWLRLVRAGAFLGMGAAVSACTHVPSFDPNPLAKSKGPPIDAVVRHLSCVLAKLSNPELKKYNFVVSVDLQMKVTQVEGANATLNFIEPYSAPQTNFTAILAGNYNATQDRTVAISYLVDMEALAPPTYCKTIGEGDEIAGDLGLQDVVNAGLGAINETSAFNRYGSKGPVVSPVIGQIGTATERVLALHVPQTAPTTRTARATAVRQTGAIDAELSADKPLLNKVLPPDDQVLTDSATETLKGFRDALTGLDAKLGADLASAKVVIHAMVAKIDSALTVNSANAAAEKSEQKGASDASAKFSTTVDFQVQEGAGVGPSWAVSTFKGPASGQTQPLNFSRTRLDTLIIAFVPSCNSDKKSADGNPQSFWDTIGPCPTPGQKAAAKAAAGNKADAEVNRTILLNSPVQQLLSH